MLRVWLDDCSPADLNASDAWERPGGAIVRDVPNSWIHVLTADQCIELLLAGQVHAISLDRDLEDFRQDPYPHEITGEDVVKWMVERKIFPNHIFIHSWNNVAARKMACMFQDAGVVPIIWPYSRELIQFLSDPKNTP